MFELGCAGAIVVRSYSVRLFSVVVLPQREAMLCIPLCSSAGRILKFNYAAGGFSGRRGVDTYAVQVWQDVAKPSDTDD